MCQSKVTCKIQIYVRIKERLQLFKLQEIFEFTRKED